MIDKFVALQEVLIDELQCAEQELENPYVSMHGLVRYMQEFSDVIDMRIRRVTTVSGRIQSLPQFPNIKDPYNE